MKRLETQSEYVLWILFWKAVAAANKMSEDKILVDKLHKKVAYEFDPDEPNSFLESKEVYY